ncbi:Glycosyl transferases group 1 [Marininema mesophilum]|uniref:Glycosyl transferases group 1 n=1 Tax=Marininema mesophilum TaxID=1048340 RepID=A0A1H3CP31_9BACL|nr:glycosyltransferase family 4 protein [Marininema mesophilum]SDX55865.1 Glycosyl transferases group 1 [Marininema mesophilum]
MKVVIPTVGLPLDGGTMNLINIALALIAKKHQVEILVGKEPIRYPLHGCKITRIPSLQKQFIPKGDIILTNYYKTFKPCFEAWPQQCVRLCQGFEPDWVKDRSFAIWTYKQNVPVISISNYLDNKVFQISGRRGIVLPLGIDHKIFHPRSMIKKQRIVKRIMYLARAPESYPVKGWNDFMRAAQLFKRFYPGKFIIDVICPERPLPLKNVPYRLLGPQKPRQMANLYRNVDLFVSSSITEGFGLPILEAMACGTPVVTTNSGGVMQFCRPGVNAIVTKPGNRRSLAIGMLRLFNNPLFSQKIAKEGLRTASDYTLNKYRGKIVKLLEEIATKRR